MGDRDKFLYSFYSLLPLYIWTDGRSLRCVLRFRNSNFKDKSGIGWDFDIPPRFWIKRDFEIATWGNYHHCRSLMPITKGTAKKTPTPRTTPDHPMASKKNPAMVIPIHPPA